MTSLQTSGVVVDRGWAVPEQWGVTRIPTPGDPLTGAPAASEYASEQSGEFRFHEGSWSWSDGLFAIHGFTRGEVVPTAELLLAHADPSDRDNLAADLRSLLADGVSFCRRYRLLDAAGRPRTVLCHGGASRPAGRPAIGGVLIDVTASERRAASEHVHEAIEDAVADRIRIEQAKGALAAVYRVDPEHAFAVLRRYSQDGNVKIRALAAGLIEQLAVQPLLDREPRAALEAILSDLIDRPARKLPSQAPNS